MYGVRYFDERLIPYVGQKVGIKDSLLRDYEYDVWGLFEKTMFTWGRPVRFRLVPSGIVCHIRRENYYSWLCGPTEAADD